MAVHTASTLVVQHRPHSELEFGVSSETNITATLLRDIDSIADMLAVIDGAIEEVDWVALCSLLDLPGSVPAPAPVHFF